ncbi:ribonuclease HII [Streptococcus sp. NLN64]|uniref:ribonuclease HII n=1 Tax=Streptococcus sp. NLN64 TaxID=2822799 RepID=UPI0018C92CF9|nr:ribonuclease HII [Streptococcus sp. NLN64]MBG9367432.1 ribonuclease HII [Streptococcus sp. NLN64]
MATIKEIQTLLLGVDRLDNPLFLDLQEDSRQGVQKLLQQRRKQLEAERVEQERLEALMSLEKDLYSQGVEWIAGVDEVGRGPLAGPVLAAAVILPQTSRIRGINDSKKLSKKKLLEMYDTIKEEAVAIGIGRVEAEIIDQVNIYQATKIAMKEAIQNLGLVPNHLLIDAMKLDLAVEQTSLIKGDARSQSIAAASIIAKVERDRLMEAYDQEFPGYDFANNVGYGTPSHLAGLRQLGPSPIHRKTFAPVKDF